MNLEIKKKDPNIIFYDKLDSIQKEEKWSNNKVPVIPKSYTCCMKNSQVEYYCSKMSYW